MKFYLFVLIALIGVSGCNTQNQTETENNGNPNGATPAASESTATETANATPKDALTSFVAAIKAKDEAGVKSALSDKTNKMFELQAKVTGKSMLDLFDSEAFEDIAKLPETRNEKIDGDKATLEAKDPDEDKWDEMAFVKENGSWKLAFLDAEYDKDYENMAKDAEKQLSGKKDDPKSGESESDTKSEPGKPGN